MMIYYFNKNVLSVYTVQTFDTDLNQQLAVQVFMHYLLGFVQMICVCQL